MEVTNGRAEQRARNDSELDRNTQFATVNMVRYSLGTKQVGLAGGIVLVAWLALRFTGGTSAKSPVVAQSAGALPTIACLGRLEPENGVRRLAAAFSVQGPSTLAELLVQEGDQVMSNQVLAITANNKTVKADYEMAFSQIKVAQGKLTQLKTGEKAGEIAAQVAELQRAQAQYANAEVEFKRNETLQQFGGISLTEFDKSRLAVEIGRKEVEHAREKLNSLEEIREVDIDPALHELDVTLASARRAEAELDRTLIRAPFSGQVIKIHVRPGEEVGRDGVLELGRTDSMFVSAEVYETDIARVKIGQRAEVSGDALTEKLTGRVAQIGMKVGKNDLLNPDPAAYADTRVVEVKIRLDDSRAAASLIHAQVTVQIFP